MARENHLTASLAIIAAAISWAFVPAIIHWTIHESNPFVFGAIFQLLGSCSLMLLLHLTRNRVSRNLVLRDIFRQRNCYVICYKPTAHGRMDIDRAERIRDIFRLPLFIITIASLNVAVFAWATQFVETAVAAAIFEIWPLFVILGMARLLAIDHKFLNVEQVRSSSIVENNVLAAVATVGLLFMLFSQTTDNSITFSNLISYRGTLGMLLSILAAGLAALNVVGSVMYGKVLQHWLNGRTAAEQTATIDLTNLESTRALLWLAIFAATASSAISIPLQLLLGLVLAQGSLHFDASAFLGATFVAIAATVTFVLIRFGNLLVTATAAQDGSDEGVNAWFYASPVLALIILMISGIDLPRLDLFVIGATLILAINILIQLKPEQETDVTRHGKDPRTGTRLGFTMLILALWTFGTILYLRDELLPAHWLELPTGDYWTLIALSATVFTLILGFRSTRLGERMKAEDELMLRLFRASEVLTTERLLSRRFLKRLQDLDTSSHNDLGRHYAGLCRSIGVARRRDGRRECETTIMDVQTKLDLLTHSKQQGRDIVELLSLTSFAFVTISLGLLARQAMLGVTGGIAWSGFLSEVFMLLFASTVAFLLMNLFDLRREREAPLIVAMRNDAGKETGQFGVFFRNKERLPVHLIGSIGISLVMAGVFIWLLYDKWLG